LRISEFAEAAWSDHARGVTLRALVAFGALATVAALALNAGSSSGKPASHPYGRLVWSPEFGPAPVASASKRKTTVPAEVSGEDFGVYLTMAQGQGASDDLTERDRADAEDQNEVLRFGPMAVRRKMVGSIMRAARRVGVDPKLLMAIADKESSFSATVKASTSSARGLFQFIDTTWLTVVRKFGPRHGLDHEAAQIEGPEDKPFIADPRERDRILAMRDYPYLSALLAAEMLKADGGKIAQTVGRELSVGETYLAHFLGPNGASLFLQTLSEEPSKAAAQVLPKPARANKPIFFEGRGKPLTIASVHGKFEDMMDARMRRYAPLGEPEGSTTVARAPASSPFEGPSAAPIAGALAYTN
jgi:hypothetical protein